MPAHETVKPVRALGLFLTTLLFFATSCAQPVPVAPSRATGATATMAGSPEAIVVAECTEDACGEGSEMQDADARSCRNGIARLSCPNMKFVAGESIDGDFVEHALVPLFRLQVCRSSGEGMFGPWVELQAHVAARQCALWTPRESHSARSVAQLDDRAWACGVLADSVRRLLRENLASRPTCKG